MATETAKIKFYRIDECGYFKHGEESPAFGSATDILQQLQNWATNGTLDRVDTKTYEPSDDSSLNPAYCFDIKRNSSQSDFLLTTWNEIPTTRGQQVASFDPNSKVGDLNVNLTSFPKNSIPGFATYFWFIPNKDVFASIKFDDSRRSNGHPELKKYITEFMAKYTTYAVDSSDKSSTEMDIEGYAKSGKEKDAEHHYPRFKSSPLRRPTNEKAIRNKQSDIRKIIRKNKIGSGLIGNINKSWFQTTFGVFTGKTNTSNPSNPVKAKYEINYKPSKSELDDMISHWKDTYDGESKWDDIGFEFEGEQGTTWLSESLVKVETDLNIKRVNNEIVNVNSLLKAIVAEKSQLLSYLP